MHSGATLVKVQPEGQPETGTASNAYTSADIEKAVPRGLPRLD